MTESAGALAVRETRAMSAEISGRMTGAQLRFIKDTEFVPKDKRGNLPAIAAAVATGRALGLDDMSAINGIHIVDGKPGFSAQIMGKLVRDAGHSVTFKATGESCTVYGKRGDNGDEGEFTWDLEMAKRAGLLGKDNWKKYPESMLYARAMSQLCRMLFPDCLAGSAYTREELGAEDVTVDELLEEAPAAGGDAPVPEPEEEPAAEVVAEHDEPATEKTGPITDDQQMRLLELVNQLTEAKPDLAVGTMLKQKIKADYRAKTYDDLAEGQMDELLRFLEGELG